MINQHLRINNIIVNWSLFSHFKNMRVYKAATTSHNLVFLF